MNVPEEMSLRLDVFDSIEQCSVAIMQTCTFIHNEIGWLMSDKHVGIGRNVLQHLSIVTTYIIFHEHRDAKELNAFYRYAITIEIMAVFGQPIDIGSEKTVVMVSLSESTYKKCLREE